MRGVIPTCFAWRRAHFDRNCARFREPLAAPDHMLVETTRVLRRWQLGGASDAETASEMLIRRSILASGSYSRGDLIPRGPWELRNQFHPG